jgi:hypothetical protein
MRVYGGSDIGSDHFLTLTKLRFSPKWLHLPKNTAGKENILPYKMRLLNDESERWLYKEFEKTKRNYRKHQYYFGLEKHQTHILTCIR